MIKRVFSGLSVAALVLAGAAASFAQDGLTESPDGPEAVKVYYTEAEAVAKVFAKADSVWTDTWELSPGERAELQGRLGWELTETHFVIHRARKGKNDLGFAVITEEKGRFKPITFIVHVSADLKVEMVLVMVYRESRGDGVKRQRFLKQFRNKDGADHLRLNRDIVGVSGATMSSRALAAGVKKVLTVVDVRYGSAKEGP